MDSQDVSRVYRQSCISSWAGLGGKVISVNSKSEARQIMDPPERLAVHVSPRDGFAKFGKPLVPLSELASAAHGSGLETVVIINSDIFLPSADALAEKVSRLRPGRAIVGRRTNVSSLAQAQGSVYVWGFDLFALHRDDLHLLQSDMEFYFGNPWWDYFLLCKLVLNGVHVEPLDSIHMLHLLHEVGFARDLWASIGRAAANHLFSIARSRKTRRSSAAGRELRGFILDLHARVHRGDRSLFAYLLHRLASGPNAEYDNLSLDEFSIGLRDFAESVLGFDNSVPDRQSMAHACQALSEALNRNQTMAP